MLSNSTPIDVIHKKPTFFFDVAYLCNVEQGKYMLVVTGVDKSRVRETMMLMEKLVVTISQFHNYAK